MDDDLRRLFDRLDDGRRGGRASARLPVDVVETADGILVMMDLPGVPPDSVQSPVRAQHARHRRPASARHLRAPRARPSTWPSARSAGSRAACGWRARSTPAARDATLTAGELRVVLPRIDERRGREIPHSVDAGRA